MSDVASVAIIYSLEPTNPMVVGLRGVNFEQTGLPSLEQVIDLYGKSLEKYSHGKLAAPRVEDVDYYIAFSFFKFCGILQVYLTTVRRCRNPV
jgi:hypothetical protein